MSDLINLNENNENNTLQQLDNILTEPNQLQGIEVQISNNNNDLINLDQNPEITGKKQKTKSFFVKFS